MSLNTEQRHAPVRLISIMGLGLILAVAGRGEETMNTNAQRVVRRAVGAGRWFPASPDTLRKMVNGYLDQAQVGPVTGRIVAAIAPHAGYQYSGPVAGYVYRAIRDQAKRGATPDVVVILGFSHRGAFPGVALMDGDAIQTPLGESPLDAEAAGILVKSAAGIRLAYAPHNGEHSAENQVPFVQAALPGTKLVIGLIGGHDPETIKGLVAALSELAARKKILVVASSDMLHDPDYDLVTKTDKKTLQAVAALDTRKLLEQWGPEHQIFCGMTAVNVVMDFAKQQGCPAGKVLYYRNSGDDYPESRGSWVVGYGAVVFVL
jgi:AmmeMemoRadiSam system protein B